MTNTISMKFLAEHPMKLTLRVQASDLRAVYTLYMITDEGTYAVGLTAQKDTYKYYYNCTPYDKPGKTKDILWGFAPRLATMLANISTASKDILTERIRMFVDPAYTIPVVPIDDYPSAPPGAESLSGLSFQLPGMSYQVTCPTDKCVYGIRRQESLRDVIMHLNDQHKWNRNKIADWLDELYKQGAPLAFEGVPDGN